MTPHEAPSEEGQKVRILICEDQGLTALTLNKTLTALGYEVVGEAADGEQGVRLAAELRPDLIFMDVNMPSLDGISAAARIMDEAPTAIVMLTAYGDAATVERALRAGALGYLVKPVQAGQLLPTISVALARRRELQDAEMLKRREEELRSEYDWALRVAEEAHRVSCTDELTGASNRRALNARLAEEIGRSRRYGRPLTLAFLDLDDFKAVNDRFGHATGDQVLRAVTAALRRNLRECDMIARYGGDEFVILLPETPPDAAQAVLLKLQKVLEQVARAEGWEISGSIGAVTYPDGSLTPSEALREADTLMYDAKQEGKGRTRHKTARVSRRESA